MGGEQQQHGGRRGKPQANEKERAADLDGQMNDQKRAAPDHGNADQHPLLERETQARPGRGRDVRQTRILDNNSPPTGHSAAVYPFAAGGPTADSR